MLRLPPHDPANYEEFVAEVERSKRVHRFPSMVPERMEGKIAKISFICGCHATVIHLIHLKKKF